MGFYKDMIGVARIGGVKHYILVDKEGQVIVHNFKDYQRTGAMIAFCGQQSFVLGKSRLKFLTFTRKSQNDLFIFPVGNYFLGVIKQNHIKTVELTDNVLSFLNGMEQNSLNKPSH